MRAGVDGNLRDTREADAQYRLRLDVSGSYRRYVRGELFVFGEGRGKAQYRGGEAREKAVRVNLDRVRVGGGIGRVRVVTPVVRALRIRGRLRAVGADASMTDADVQAAARQLARRPGYEAVYDRPDKCFWRDLFSKIRAADGPAPFEAFYVADVLREPVGVRREGAELRLGPSLGPTGSYRQ
ncbi:MAG: hypothetical protein BRD55_10095 [Bacteroidetes bacterium SW_9_63_38]|nr:MAG: hypothetical protein BRD55_10095 [Bacteroidetes bacterium SW_9_63_38]